MTGELVYLLLAPCLAFCNQGDDQQEAVETYHTTVGQFLQLECHINSSFMGTERNSNVTWSRDNNQSLDVTTSRVRMWNGTLLFLPVEYSDSGHLTCKGRGPSEHKEMFLLVESGVCPGPSDTKAAQQGAACNLSCGQEHVFTLGQQPHVSWLKDCNPMDQQGKTIRISKVTSSNVGHYTCQIHFSFEGKNYTTSRTTLLIVKDAEAGLVEPKVIHPREETIQVEPGAKTELSCTAFIGMSENTEFESSVYWTVNYSFVEAYKTLNQTVKYVKENRNFYGLSRLFIAEVRAEFFHVPFHCIVITPMGRDFGAVWLSPVNRRDLHTVVIICLAVAVFVAGLVIYRVLKVDVVLAYRRLCCSSPTEKDGKLYDAYVSFLHGGALCSSRAKEFSLRVLPEVLEQRHGYRLFINGRDDRPGEAANEVIADTIRNSRRLVIVLSAQSQANQKQENLVLWDCNQDRPDLEQLTSLCDALIRSEIQVILLETDKDIDYSLFPASLRHVRQKHGALRWRPSSNDPTVPPNGRFWKCLRYRMPPEARSDHSNF